MNGDRDSGGLVLPMAFDRGASREAFAVELERLDALLLREICRLRTRYQLSLDEFRGLYVSDQQVDELTRRARPTDEDLDERLAWAQNELALADPPTVFTPWECLRNRLSLSRLERDLLLLCLAPELDAKYETLYAYLNNDVTRKWPTAELAARLLGNDPAGRAAVRALAQPDAAIVRIGLIEGVAATRELPRNQRGLRIAPALADWLLGLPYSDEALHAITRLLTVQSSPALGAPSSEIDKGAARIAADESTNLVCIAGSVDEAMGEAHRLLAQAGRDALLFDLAAFRTATPDLVVALERAAAVLGLGIVLAPVDALSDTEGRMHDAALTLARRIARRGLQLVWAGGPESRWREIFAGNDRVPCQVVQLAELDSVQRAEVWRDVLRDRVDAAGIAMLADRFVFGPSGIERVMRHAEAQASFDGAALSQQTLLESARAVSTESASGVTRRVSTRFDWSQLVLPQPIKRRLHDVVSAIESRPVVLDKWGFAEKLGNARGVKVLFAGQSGTGKTMAAAIIARTLSLDLHRVELAAVVSKYIGETEKNLDRAFETARRSNSILFIDEADALLGKRSEVKDAHDRYANLETAYLLQKMEEHEGVVILASNLAANLDEAFSRRMHFVIDFPMPDAASRERLWRGMIPARAPVAADVDLGFLARQFVFAGGDIRNVVLDAAYLAAQESGEIAMRHFLAAVARQFAKRGKLPTAGEFKEYFGMLADGVQVTSLEARREVREGAL